MNIIIPPNVVALLRYAVALIIAIAVSYTIGSVGGGLTGVYLPFLLVFCVPFIVMIAPKREILFGFFMTTVAWGHNAITTYLIDKQAGSNFLWQNIGDAIALWLFTLLLSLIATTPIYFWRQRRRRRQVNSASVSAV